ncbi:MAG: hypothetical protein OXH63_13030 [Gemmatimonadetes bacterium]|nr:hypothetical protein [Gemmatimonadota bacterium]
MQFAVKLRVRKAAVTLRLHRIGEDLQAPVRAGTSQLLFGRIAVPQGHGHELADDSLFDAISVEPWLLGDDDVVLWIGVEVVAPPIPVTAQTFPVPIFTANG